MISKLQSVDVKSVQKVLPEELNCVEQKTILSPVNNFN